MGLQSHFAKMGMVWITLGGFLGAHVFEMVAYQPERLLADPLSMLEVVKDWSSFGGFIGGSIALYFYSRRKAFSMLAYLDAMMFGFAPGWSIARSSCFLAHDHPGIKSDFILAVAYAGGARHDLGFYEMLLAMFVTLVLYLLRSQRYRKMGQGPHPYDTLAGMVSVERCLYREVGVHNGPTVDPVSLRAGVVGDGWLPLTAQAMAHLLQQGTSREAASTGSVLHRLPYSRCSFEDVGRSGSQCWTRRHIDQSLRHTQEYCQDIMITVHW